MYSSVLNAVMKLLLSQGNKVNYLKGGGGLPEKATTDVLTQVLGFPGVNFCLGVRLQEVTLVMCRVFGDFFK